MSEVMLQQTTVATVRGRYPEFLRRFPTAAAMAAAPLDEVMHAWQGLGYYRRARALHACAQQITATHQGVVPTGREALLALPGLGRYTTHAVAAIAFGQPIVPVDANVTRVIIRLLGLRAPADRVRSVVEAAAQELARPTRASDLAQALMELGALVCKPRAPRCDECPWRDACAAHRDGLADQLPQLPAKRARHRLTATAYLLSCPAGRILFERRPAAGLLGGMVTLPMSSPVATDEPDGAVMAPPGAVAVHELPGAVRHLFTHIELTVRLATGRTARDLPGLWTHRDALRTLALPTLTKKLLLHGGVQVQPQASGRQAS